MKDRTEITSNGRAVFYAVLYQDIRKTALDCGYALALHGSMASDMDMIAVPWVEEAEPESELIKRISDCLGKTIWKDFHFKPATPKPHARRVYTLSIFSDYYIDLSVVGDERQK